MAKWCACDIVWQVQYAAQRRGIRHKIKWTCFKSKLKVMNFFFYFFFKLVSWRPWTVPGWYIDMCELTVNIFAPYSKSSQPPDIMKKVSGHKHQHMQLAPFISPLKKKSFFFSKIFWVSSWWRHSEEEDWSFMFIITTIHIAIEKNNSFFFSKIFWGTKKCLPSIFFQMLQTFSICEKKYKGHYVYIVLYLVFFFTFFKIFAKFQR